jgi:nucleotide-binding universal stress UspA family protein
MNKTILVLTDFSENSWTAITYASYLAREFNWTVQLLHTFTSIIKDNINLQLENTSFISPKEQGEDMLVEWRARLDNVFPNLRCEMLCLPGDLIKTVLDLLHQHEYSFIVMGAKGKGMIKKAFLGSNTFALIKKSPIGVLAVPITFTKFQLLNIGLLSNFKESEYDLLGSFTTRLPTNFKLTLLHVTQKYISPKQEDIEEWKKKLSSRFSLNEIDYLEKNAVNRLDYNMPIPRCIAYMVETGAIDFLLVSYSPKSFFKSMFSRNLTKAIYRNLAVPTFFKSS